MADRGDEFSSPAPQFKVAGALSGPRKTSGSHQTHLVRQITENWGCMDALSTKVDGPPGGHVSCNPIMTEEVRIKGLIDVAQTEVALLLESGYLYLEMQKHKEAEDIFTGVAALVPHSDVPLICLGNLFFSQGRFDRALKFHKEALGRNPDSALAQAHLGEALMFMGRRDQAKQALDKAVQMDPDGDAGAFAKSLLDGAAAEVI